MLKSKEWWSVIQNYDLSIWPSQLILLALGIIIVGAFILKPERRQVVIVKLYLITIHLWTAVIFFLWPQRGFPSPLRESQGFLFIIIAVFLIYDLVANKTELNFPRKGGKRIAGIAAVIIVFAYPLWGLLMGHAFDHLIYPGSFPCPNTALTLIFVITARRKKNPVLYLLLLIWAIPFPPMVQIPNYQAFEDGILFASGMAALIHLISYYLSDGVKLKTDQDKIGALSVVPIVYSILKAYVRYPKFVLYGALLKMPGFIKRYKADYSKDFLKTCGLLTLLYSRLRKMIGQEKAFEVIRALMMSAGLAVQQINFRNVEATRNFKNLVNYQQRTNKEGPTKNNKMEIIEQSERRYEFRVTKCMFFEFFNSLGVPELTKLMCSIDNAIFNSYSPEKITFHRNGIGNRIADGAKYCSFVVENNESKI